jgi:hypothetical protein
MECEHCGHVFNHVTTQDIDNLKSYYRREYADGRFTKTEINNNFLGVQYDNNSVVITQENINSYIDLLIQINSDKFNELWPTRNFIALDQFLEHCWNLDAVMQYLRQTLPPNGKVYISVPDFGRYDIHYYYLIKEHIQHFSIKSIVQLFTQYGFTIDQKNQSLLPILGGTLQLPIIEFVFINNKPKEQDGVYCYGAGRELTYALDNNLLSDYIIDGIIDDTPSKQNRKINGIPIYSGNKVQELSEQSTIIITAYYSRDKIKDNLADYKGTIVTPDITGTIQG